MMVRIAYAASNQLADNRADINAGKRRDQRLQDLAAADAADRAGDRVAERAEVVIFERRSGAIAANHAGD